jgi:aminopeptidase-like protein
MTANGVSPGLTMYELVRELYPICRSLTGDGVRQSLAILKRYMPTLKVTEIASGTPAFDWVVPEEWNIREAYLLDPDGNKIVDFRTNNLHVVGYSEPVDLILTLDELQPHLHSRSDLPDAIPYVTSYYQRRWGFCLTHHQRESLKAGTYRAVIDSTLEPGHLTYGEVILPGDTAKEVFVSTYICHPSMANNECSGPVVSTFLAQWAAALPHRTYSYRFVFIPETIGSIVYLSRHLAELKRQVVAGFNVSCVGDDRSHSYLPSRQGDTLADQIALHVLQHVAPDFTRHTFLNRGSDERQYCSPGVDLPVVSVMRTKYGTYPEYHTSLDDLSLVTPDGLAGGFLALRRCIESLEANRTYRAAVLCEPQMGKRGLYSTLGVHKLNEAVKTRMNILAYCDGRHSVLDIANILAMPVWSLAAYFDELERHDLIAEIADHPKKSQRAARDLLDGFLST